MVSAAESAQISKIKIVENKATHHINLSAEQKAINYMVHLLGSTTNCIQSFKFPFQLGARGIRFLYTE